MKLEIEIDDKKIRAAIEKAGKLDVYELEYIARETVRAVVKKEIKKVIPNNLEAFIKKTIKKMDWNKIISDTVESLSRNDD